MSLEEKLKMVLPNGYKDLGELRRIGEALSKNEAVQKGLPVDDSGVVQPPQESELVRRLSQLDAVDRNLVRSATVKS